ncbi:MAG: hypothetical protein V4507_16545 [Verrucomicrobiota bacterium]
MNSEPKIGDTLLKNSALYQEFLAEREEILRHKWIESEKVGHDIGFEKALLDWIVRHRATWRANRQPSVPSGRSSVSTSSPR